MPCYNEEEHIEQAVHDLDKALTGLHLPWEILVVDDHSSDASPKILQRLASGSSSLRVIRNPTNLGLGGAYRVGVQNAKYSHVMIFPGDNEVNAESMRKICDHLGEADVLLSYSDNPELRKMKRRMISWLFTMLVNLICLRWIKYYNGPSIMPKKLLSQINLRTNSFAYQAEIIVQLMRLGATIKEFPFHLNYRSVRMRALSMSSVFVIGQTLARMFFVYWFPAKSKAVLETLDSELK